MKGLDVRENAGEQAALVRQHHPNAAAQRRPLRIVLFLRAVDGAGFSVVPSLAEIAAPDEGGDRSRGPIVQLHVEVPKIDRRIVVDRAALALDDNRKAVGGEDAAIGSDAHFPPEIGAGKIELRAVQVSVLRLDVQRPPHRSAGDDVDHASHRVVAVQARSRPVDHLDPIRRLERDTRPVHPAAERIVERHAVEQHQRTADATRSHAAKRYSLRGRVRRQTARSPEQTEGRNPSQDVVGDERGRLLDLFAAHDADARRHVAEALIPA